MNQERLRKICMNLAGVTEDIKWGADICFMVGAKMFCITGMHDDDAITIKVHDDEFEELTERDGVIPAPYLGRNKWICVVKRSALKPKEWEHYIKQSYELIKAKLPKKVQKEMGL